MSDNDAGFRDKHQELDRLTQELKQMKDLLREVASRMSQIERHVKRAFIPLPPLKRDSQGKGNDRLRKTPEKPTISEQQALGIFDELKSLSLSGGSERAVEQLERIPSANLKLLAHELGLTFRSKPSKKVLISGIRGRINESLMLSRNVNVTQPRSATADNPKHESVETNQPIDRPDYES